MSYWAFRRRLQVSLPLLCFIYMLAVNNQQQRDCIHHQQSVICASCSCRRQLPTSWPVPTCFQLSSGSDRPRRISRSSGAWHQPQQQCGCQNVCVPACLPLPASCLVAVPPLQQLRQPALRQTVLLMQSCKPAFLQTASAGSLRSAAVRARTTTCASWRLRTRGSRTRCTGCRAC